MLLYVFTVMLFGSWHHIKTLIIDKFYPKISRLWTPYVDLYTPWPQAGHIYEMAGNIYEIAGEIVFDLPIKSGCLICFHMHTSILFSTSSYTYRSVMYSLFLCVLSSRVELMTLKQWNMLRFATIRLKWITAFRCDKRVDIF